MKNNKPYLSEASKIAISNATNINPIDPQKGSSLVGVSLLTLALGFLITGGVYLMQNYETIQSDQKGLTNARQVEAAIKDFVAREKRYPCPAPIGAAPDTATFGKEAANCAGTFSVTGRAGKTVNIGAVPVRSLNIADSMIADGYGKRYFYAITRDLATAGTDTRYDEGAITIQNQNGDSISDAPGFITYAIMSPGVDDRGAYNMQGTLIAPCSTVASEDASSNCEFITGGGDATFVSSSEKRFGTDSDTFTHSFTFAANSTPYKWFTSAWNNCAGVCFSGTQSRTVNCRDHKDTVVANSNCSYAPAPANSRACALPACTWQSTLGACTTGTPTPPTGSSGGTDGSSSSSGGIFGGGDGGGDGGDGGYSDSNGDSVGDSPTADGGPHGSTDGTGDGGDGGSVLCGHFFERNIITPEIYQGDLAFAQDHVSNAAKRGYRLWAVPLTKHLNANPNGAIEKMAQPFVISWAQEMAYRAGHSDEGHWLGKLQLKIVKPIVGFVGLFVNDTKWSHLESEKKISKNKE